MASFHFSTGLMQFEIGHTVTGSQSEMLTSKGSFASVFWLFQSSSWTTSEKLLGCQSNLPDFRVLNSFFFFFYTVGRNVLLREDINFPLSAPVKLILISILSRWNLSLLSSRVSFLIPFFSFRSPYPLVEIQVLSEVTLLCSFRDIITKFISLYWVLVVACGIFSCSL